MCIICFYTETLRLKYGLKDSAGQIEVYNKVHDEYDIICDRHWDLKDADVVCCQLGYPSAKQATTRSYFTHRSNLAAIPSMFTAFDNVDCTGSEKSIFECMDIFGDLLDLSTTASCPSNSAAGVICDG